MTPAETRLLSDAVCLLWDVYNDDKTGTHAERIAEFLADADPEGWADEAEAAHDYAETDRAQQGAI
jgi:hypothetical protein